MTLSNAAYLSDWKGHEEIRLPLDQAEFDEWLDRKQADSNCHSSPGDLPLSREYSERWRVNW